MKKALITGITGQDGSYLAEFLLEKGYEVHGIVRRASISNTARIDHLIEKNAITLHDGDLSDSSGLIRLVGEIKPDEIYNLAAQSHVQVSFDAPEYSGDVDALGVLRVLEAVRVCGLTKTCKVYQASTSELYGKVEEVPQRETTPFHPYSPYATKGISLLDKLEELYKTYGYCLNTLHSYEFDGSAGFAKMQSIMQAFRGDIKAFGGRKVVKLLDYAPGLDGLPKSDVLKFLLEDNCSIVVRPSGTEPKLKTYISVSAENKEAAEKVEAEIRKSAEAYLK